MKSIKAATGEAIFIMVRKPINYGAYVRGARQLINYGRGIYNTGKQAYNMYQSLPPQQKRSVRDRFVLIRNNRAAKVATMRSKAMKNYGTNSKSVGYLKTKKIGRKY